MLLNLRHQTQIMLGLYEHELGDTLRQLTHDLSSAVDVGSSEGAYTLFFALRTQASRLYAFEPDDAARTIMITNLSLNGVPLNERIVLSNRSVGETETTTTCRLDTAIDISRLPCLIKVDVEGGELGVLRGAPQLLGSQSTRWLIETHSAELELACVEMLRTNGYKTKVIANAWWRALVPEMRPIAHNRWLVGWKL
jgi:hypothetical protein